MTRINEGLDLAAARELHTEQGGYLLRIGEAGGSLTQDRDGFVVCDEDEAINLYGRTPEELAALAPHYNESR